MSENKVAHFSNAERKELLLQNFVSSKNCFRIKDEMKPFSNEGKIREFIARLARIANEYSLLEGK